MSRWLVGIVAVAVIYATAFVFHLSSDGTRIVQASELSQVYGAACFDSDSWEAGCGLGSCSTFARLYHDFTTGPNQYETNKCSWWTDSCGNYHEINTCSGS